MHLAMAALLIQTCDIYERAATKTGVQPVVPTPTLKISGVRCRVWPLSSREQATLIGRMIQATHRILMRTVDVPAGFAPGWDIVCSGARYRVQECSDVGGVGEVTQALLVVVPQ
ncbi:MAG: hypothetical protein QME79_12290 [Bacillota bacterium]|nr:hypothetical protein [Bacillota bacterium]